MSMCPAALHDEQWTVLLVWFWNVLDCRFPVLSAFHKSPELLSAEHYPQAGFPAASYEDDPAQTFFCAGFLCPPHIRESPLLLRRGHRYALRLLCFRSAAYILRMLTWHILCQRRGWHNLRLTRLFRRGERRCCSLFCSFLNIRAPGLLLRCGC